MRTLSLMKPHRKHGQSLKAISYECFNIISFSHYFQANYGILIPYKYIHKKINAHQILTKLTQLFHTLKKTRKRNHKLTQSLKQLQNEINTLNLTKKVKSTSQKSLESIIYDQNGNSYHHHQKITETTTHSYRPFNKHNDNEDDSTIVSTPTTKPVDTEHKTEQKTEVHADQDADDDDTTKYVSPSNSASDKAVDGVKDNHSDRCMSDSESCLVVDDPPKKEPEPQPTTSTLLASFNPEEEVIHEENEQDYSLETQGNRSTHTRRYSAPWDDKKLKQDQFGTAYAKMYDPYWKNSGSRDVLSSNHHPNNEEQKEDDTNYHKHQKACDSAELNMLPMIKEDPTTNRIYRLSRVHNNPQRHKRSVSVGVVNMPSYFIDVDEEYPALPDL
eukprot:281254_1